MKKLFTVLFFVLATANVFAQDTVSARAEIDTVKVESSGYGYISNEQSIDLNGKVYVAGEIRHKVLIPSEERMLALALNFNGNEFTDSVIYRMDSYTPCEIYVLLKCFGIQYRVIPSGILVKVPTAVYTEKPDTVFLEIPIVDVDRVGIIRDVTKPKPSYLRITNRTTIKTDVGTIAPGGITFSLLKCPESRIQELLRKYKNVKITDDVVFNMHGMSPYEVFRIFDYKKVRGAVTVNGIMVRVPEAYSVNKSKPRMMDIELYFGDDRVYQISRLTKINRTGIQDISTMFRFLDAYKDVTGEDYKP